MHSTADLLVNAAFKVENVLFPVHTVQQTSRFFDCDVIFGVFFFQVSETARVIAHCRRAKIPETEWNHDLMKQLSCNCQFTTAIPFPSLKKSFSHSRGLLVANTADLQ